jgi:anti-sigma regulatory factor (Ser/Thr protein kinase)
MSFRATRSMQCAPALATVARAWADEQLAATYTGLGDMGDDAALVVSELVTNSMQAGAHVVDLTLHGDHGVLRVEVTDDAPGWPKMSAVVALDQVRGRGLRIVDAVAAAWGARPERVGKTVWAELVVPAPAPIQVESATSCVGATRRRVGLT